MENVRVTLRQREVLRLLSQRDRMSVGELAALLGTSSARGCTKRLLEPVSIVQFPLASGAICSSHDNQLGQQPPAVSG